MATATTPFAKIECGECGISFWVPQTWQEDRREDGGTFFCPNGHRRAYVETEAMRLRKALEAQRAKTAAATELALQATADRDAVTAKLERLKKRRTRA